jgi:hypothetical protein
MRISQNFVCSSVMRHGRLRTPFHETPVTAQRRGRDARHETTGLHRAISLRCAARPAIWLDTNQFARSSNQCRWSGHHLVTNYILLSSSGSAVVFNFLCSRTPRCNFTSTLYPQTCWCLIQVIHSLQSIYENKLITFEIMY